MDGRILPAGMRMARRAPGKVRKAAHAAVFKIPGTDKVNTCQNWFASIVAFLSVYI